MHDCIQYEWMRCICKAVSSRGEQYNPALKTVYWREGANGKFVKIGYRCPNCGVFYQLDDKKMIR